MSKALLAIAFGKAVNDFRAQLKSAGYDKVQAELQKRLDAFKQQVESSK